MDNREVLDMIFDVSGYTYESGNSYPAALLNIAISMALAPDGGLLDAKDLEKLAEWFNRLAKLDRDGWETVYVNTCGKCSVDIEDD